MHHNGCLTDAGMLCQDRLDFPEFDAKAADFDLMVDAAEKLDIAIEPVTGKISRLVEPRACLGAKGIRDELFCCQLGAVQIAARQAISANIELSRYPDRQRLQVAVQNVNLRIGDWPANREDRIRSDFLGNRIVQVKVVLSVGP